MSPTTSPPPSLSMSAATFDSQRSNESQSFWSPDTDGTDPVLWCPASGFDASVLERRIRADLADCVREYNRTQDAIKTQTQLQNTCLMWPGIWRFVDDSQLKSGFFNFVGSVLYGCHVAPQGAVAIPEQTLIYYVYDRQRVFLKTHKAPPTHQQIRATSVGQRLASSTRHDYGIPSDLDWKADWAQTKKAMSSAARTMRSHNRPDAESAKSKKAVSTSTTSSVTKAVHGPTDSVVKQADPDATAPAHDATSSVPNLSEHDSSDALRSPLTFGEVAILQAPQKKSKGVGASPWGPPPTASRAVGPSARPGKSIPQRDNAGASVPSFLSIQEEQAQGHEPDVAPTFCSPDQSNGQPQSGHEVPCSTAAAGDTTSRADAELQVTRYAAVARAAHESRAAAETAPARGSPPPATTPATAESKTLDQTLSVRLPSISAEHRPDAMAQLQAQPTAISSPKDSLDVPSPVDKDEILLARVRAESMAPFLSPLQKVELQRLLDRLRYTMNGAGPSSSRVDENAVALIALQDWLRCAVLAHPPPVHASVHASHDLKPSAPATFQPQVAPAHVVAPRPDAQRPMSPLKQRPTIRSPDPVRQTQEHIPADERVRSIRACYKDGDFVKVPNSLAPYFATWRQPAAPHGCTYVATFHHTFDGTCLAQPCAQFSDAQGRLHHLPYTLVWQDDDMPHDILGAKIRADEFFETTSVCNDPRPSDISRGRSASPHRRSGSKHGLRVARATLRRREARERRREDDRLLAALPKSSSQRQRDSDLEHDANAVDDPSSGGSSDTSSSSSTSSTSSSFPASVDLSSSARRSDSTWMAKKRRSLPYKRKAARERFDALVRSRRRFFGPEEFNVGALPTRPQPFSFLELMTELRDFCQAVPCQERWLVAWFPELLDGYALEMKHNILLALTTSPSATHGSRRSSSSMPSSVLRSNLRLCHVEQAMRTVFYSAEQRDLAESQLSVLALPNDLLAGNLVRSFHDTERTARDLCYVLDFPDSTLSAVTRRLVKGIKAFEVLWSHLLREKNYNTLVGTIKSHLESYAANRRYDPGAHVEFVKDMTTGIDNVHAIGADNASKRTPEGHGEGLYDYNKHKKPTRVITCWGCGSTGHKLPQCTSPDAAKNGAEKLRLFRERMAQRRKKGNRVTYADYDRLADALHQCASLGNAAGAAPDGSRTPPTLEESGSDASSDEEKNFDDQVDADVQFFHDEADDTAAVHRLDTFAFEHEFLPPRVPEPQPNFCFKPHCWWQ